MKNNDILTQMDEAIQYFIDHEHNEPHTEFCINVDKLINLKSELANDTNTSKANLNITDVIIPFMVWAIREAKIDVVNISDAIEVHGFREDDMLIPVITLPELILLYKLKNGL